MFPFMIAAIDWFSFAPVLGPFLALIGLAIMGVLYAKLDTRYIRKDDYDADRVECDREKKRLSEADKEAQDSVKELRGLMEASNREWRMMIDAHESALRQALQDLSTNITQQLMNQVKELGVLQGQVNSVLLNRHYQNQSLQGGGAFGG